LNYELLFKTLHIVADGGIRFWLNPIDGGAREMLGISGWGCWLAYIISILSTILCIIYGIAMWNRGAEKQDEAEITKWVKEEREIEERF
jgi:hypothetical protein